MKAMQLRNPVIEWSEVRAMPEDGQPRRLSGYAAKWDSYTPFYNEMIERGAFTKSLLESDQLALVNHDRTLVLGRVGAGTLQLREDNVGLAFQLTLPDTTYARDIWESVARGDTAGCSFGFSPIKTTTRKMPSGTMATVITEAALFEVSITAFPAYAATEVQARETEQPEERTETTDTDASEVIYQPRYIVANELKRIRLETAKA